MLRVLQGPTWFRSNASKLRFEPWYGFQAVGFWEQMAPETLTGFREFSRQADAVPSFWPRLF